jgi:D-glycero-alpha-D-manno-heptose 1-phosphate guanylyltransferase
MHNTATDAIILAGGKGTRLRSVLTDIPKPMAPVNGKPFLDILLSQLNQYPAIRNVVLSVGYKSDIIVERYTNSSAYNFRILFSNEKTPLGTGGAIKKALSSTNTDGVLVLNGDSYIQVDINELINYHISRNASLTMVLKELNDTSRYGIINISDQNKILSFEEKKNTNHTGLINAGVYLINKSLFDSIDKDCEISFERQILPDLIRGNAYGYITSEKFIDIGIPETYRAAQDYLTGI